MRVRQNTCTRSISEGCLVCVCGACVGKFELVRFVVWVALHPEEVDRIPLIWVVFCFSLVCGLPQYIYTAIYSSI